jgi:hypothetical protein
MPKCSERETRRTVARSHAQARSVLQVKKCAPCGDPLSRTAHCDASSIRVHWGRGSFGGRHPFLRLCLDRLETSDPPLAPVPPQNADSSQHPAGVESIVFWRGARKPHRRRLGARYGSGTRLYERLAPSVPVTCKFADRPDGCPAGSACRPWIGVAFE